jgi:hypothetical protein
MLQIQPQVLERHVQTKFNNLVSDQNKIKILAFGAVPLTAPPYTKTFSAPRPNEPYTNILQIQPQVLERDVLTIFHSLRKPNQKVNILHPGRLPLAAAP